MTGAAGLASTGAAAAGGVSTGLTWTAAERCTGSGADFAATGCSEAGFGGAAFGTATEDGVRLAIFGIAGDRASRRLIGSSGPYEGRGGGAP